MEKNDIVSNSNEYFVELENVKINLYFAKSVLQETNITLLSLHAHMHTELFACTEGKIKIATNTKTISLTAGDLAIFPAGFLHCLHSTTPHAKWNAASFSVAPHFSRNQSTLWQRINNICSGTLPHVFKKEKALCVAVDTLCQNNAITEPCLPALRLALVLTELANSYVREIEKNITSHQTSTDVERFVSLELLIEGHYTEDISAETIASYLHVSPRQLQRIMQKQYGTNLKKLLCEKRLFAATYLLTSTNDTIDQICHTIGFKNISDFYNKFRKRYHMTPKEYRKQHTDTAQKSLTI